MYDIHPFHSKNLLLIENVSQTALPVIEKLDPYNFFIMYKLFRESTRSSENGPVKDLSYLNRPLDRVIIVRTQIFSHYVSYVDASVCVQLDTHPEHVATNPENAIILKPWKGEPGDKGLIEFIPFLECEACPTALLF